MDPTLSILFSKLKFLSLAAQTLGYYYVSLLLKYRFGEARFSLRAIYLEMSMLFRKYCYATSTLEASFTMYILACTIFELLSRRTKRSLNDGVDTPKE